jgi:predicted nucleotidyltransferase
MVDRVVDTILNHCDPELIFLFGSVAKGTARYGSDIDILVVMETDEKPIKRGMDILDDIDVDTSVDLIVMTPREFSRFREDPSSFTSHILSSGRIVYGTARLR